MHKPFSIFLVTTEYPSGVLVCNAYGPRSQKVVKTFEPQLKQPATLASAGVFDTDAVALAEGYGWKSATPSFRIYQWRTTELGLSVEPWAIASVSFPAGRWPEALGFCQELVDVLNLGPLTDTARQIIAKCQCLVTL